MRISATVQQGITLELYVGDCPGCGVVYGVSKDYDQRRREDGKGFYCPNGHSMSFGKSAADKEREKRQSAERDAQYYRESATRLRAEKAAAENSLRTTKGHLTRVKKRIEAGVCIHCNRTFQSLAKHMQTKHAEEIK